MKLKARYNMTMENLNTYIDHTLLKATASQKDILNLCQEAIEHNFKAVCIPPKYVAFAKKALLKSPVLVCTVVGFPLGSNSTAVKAFETKCAIEDGADEIDMVINVSALKELDLSYVEKDIASVVQHAKNKTVKVILETCYLTEKEIIYACEASAKAGAHFVKTSTGFGSSGANLDDVKLMKGSISHIMQIKASGGIKSMDEALLFIQAGADRIGTSSGIQICKENVSDAENDNSDSY